MNLTTLKSILTTIDNVSFELENGIKVPAHYHLTEIGMITKKFIDCGGTIREEKSVNFQLWAANDYNHRLKPSKFIKIIELSEKKLGIENCEIEVEFQSETIGKYDLNFDGINFILKNKSTACLASDHCGNPNNELSKSIIMPTINQTCCAPNTGCC